MALDYGAAVSQKGYDVKTCADRFLVYSSAFQTLKVYNTYSVSTTIPSGTKHTITINHNLGYYAPFIVVYNGSSRIGVSRSYFFADSKTGSLDAQNTINTLTIDIYLNFDMDSDPAPQAGDTVYFTVYLFLNDFTSISHAERNTGTSSGSSSTDYGIRISKAGFDVSSCDDKDCVLSSSFFNQVIDQVGVFEATADGYDQEISITDQGYVPSVLAYYKDVNYSYITYFTLEVSSDKLTAWELWDGDLVYYIIFKNKLN